MSKSSLELARTFLSRRKFSQVITLLESKAEYYTDNFEYYWLMGTACLYIGELGTAKSCYSRARSLRPVDVQVLIGIGACYLCRGDTQNAVSKYLEVLDYEPSNQTAKAALEFIRTSGNYENIQQCNETGRLQKFYPTLGVNPDIVRNSVLLGLGIGLVVSVIITLLPVRKNQYMVGSRGDMSSLVLTTSEKNNAAAKDLSGSVITTVLKDREIVELYEKALEFFRNERDNMAQRNINRIFNSNASKEIKAKCQLLQGYLEIPRIDTLRDNFTYQEVADRLEDYENCYVFWSGRIANSASFEDGSWSCDLLVGYDENVKIEGIAPLKFQEGLSAGIDPEKVLKVLAQIKIVSGRLQLSGVAYYQPLPGKINN